MNYINLKFGGKFLINLKQNELVILSIFDYENNPIGKTELIKTIFLFSKLLDLKEIFKFNSDIFGPNEEDGCITAEINRYPFIISSYDSINNENIYYFEENFFEKYKSSFIQKIESILYLKLLNNIQRFMKSNKLKHKIALIYTLFPEFTVNSIIKDDLEPFFHTDIQNRYLRELLFLIPENIFTEVFDLIKGRLKPFIFLDRKNKSILLYIVSIINKFQNFKEIFPILNELIKNVVDLNYKNYLEYILFILTKNSVQIKSNEKIKKSIIINLLKLDIETPNQIVGNSMNIFADEGLTYSIFTK